MTLEESPNERPHVFFDMDGTITESRTEITKDMTILLRKLALYADVSIVSGAKHEQMVVQVPWIDNGMAHAMSQSGNHTQLGLRVMWNNELPEELVPFIMKHIEQVMTSEVYQTKIQPYNINKEDLIQIRGGQVSFSMIGHNADKKLKAEFDPTGSFRSYMMMSFPLEHEDIEVRMGGTTCLDYTRWGWNKAGNINRLLAWRGWMKDRCLYVGDALRPGGNDEVMLDQMVCREVSGPDETMKFISELIEDYKNV